MMTKEKITELHPDMSVVEEPKLEKNEFIVDLGGILVKDEAKYLAIDNLVIYKIAHTIQQTLFYGPNGTAEDDDKEEGLLISVKVYQEPQENWKMKYRVETKLHY